MSDSDADITIFLMANRQGYANTHTVEGGTTIREFLNDLKKRFGYFPHRVASGLYIRVNCKPVTADYFLQENDTVEIIDESP